MKKFFLLLVFCFSLFTLYAENTPTASFLKHYPLEKIGSIVKKQSNGTYDKKKWFPFFLDVSKHEGPGFFGYHATTSSHFLIHLVLKSTFEELYGYQFPEDFYFLRAPLGHCYEFSDKSEFLKQFAVPKLSVNKQRKMINLLLLKPLQKATKVSLPLSCIPKEHYEQLQIALLHFFSESGPRPPTTRLGAVNAIKAAFKDHPKKKVLLAKINKWFKNPKKYFTLEKNKVHIKEDDAYFIYKAINPIRDSDGDMQKILLSMNIALFSNFSCPGESTIHVIANNQSIELDGDQLSKKILSNFFKKIGYPIEIVADLIDAKQAIFDHNEGVLLQFFDATYESDNPELNRFAYISKPYGMPLFEHKPTTFIANFNPNTPLMIVGKGKDQMIADPQLRLVMTSRETLNPFSWLRIKCHHNIPKASLDAFTQVVREKLQSYPYDEAKVAAYGTALKEKWNQ